MADITSVIYPCGLTTL